MGDDMLVRSGIPVLVIRGGTTKGAYFRADDLPFAPGERRQLMLGGPAGADHVVVVSRSPDPHADVDCELPPAVDACAGAGLLAGAGAFAIERGMAGAAGTGAGRLRDVSGAGGVAKVVPVRVRTVATGMVVTVLVPVRGGCPDYAGETAISGVPGVGARVLIEFTHAADSPLLPTGRVIDDLHGVPATLIGAGAPVVLVAASALGVSGYETPARLEYDARLLAHLEAVRMRAGQLLGLGDVSKRPLPEMCLVAPPADGGGLCVRMFVPDRVHTSVTATSAMSVAAAATLPGTVATRYRRPAAAEVPRDVLRLEHPTGFLDVQAEVSEKAGVIRMTRSAMVTTVRPLLDGQFFPHSPDLGLAAGSGA
jgi:4-oxalomesaconate tautomerase